MFRNLSIGLKIAFIAIVGFIGILIFQSANYRLSVNLRDQLHKVFTEDFVVLKFSNDIQINFSDLDKLYQAALIEVDMDTLKEADIKAEAMRVRFQTFQDDYHLGGATYNELVKLFDEYTHITSQHTASVLKGELDYQQTLVGYDQIGVLRQRYERAQSQFFEQSYSEFEHQLQLIQDEGHFLVEFGLVLGICLTAILGLISFFVIKNLIYAFNNAVNVAQQIASGDFEQEIVPRSTDETGKMLLSLKAMRDALKKQRDDDLQREHTQDFLNGLNETMRGDPELEQLLQSVLDYLALQFQVDAGHFYLCQDDKLLLKATWGEIKGGWHQAPYEKSYIGHVAQSRDACILNDIAENQSFIETSLGSIKCKSLMLVPIYFESTQKGLIELGASHSFCQNDLLLMEKANDAIAIAINSTLAREALAKILGQTQKQAEILKKQRHELEISGRYKTQFLSTMSHELRTPLNSILILSESLINNRNGSLSSQDIQQARVIHNAGSDLLTLINDILDLSKIEEGKMEIVWEKFNIRQLADNIFHSFDLQARNKHLVYEVDVANDVPVLVCSDSLRLSQILKNFISNSLKFTEKGGIYVNFTQVDSQTAGSRNLVVTVRDTGVGIINDKQHDIFEAFTQLDGTTSRKYGGTGLGLSISRELAKLLKGEIGLYSEGENKGCSFTLTVPLEPHLMNDGLLSAPQSEDVAERQSPAQPCFHYAQADLRVLVVEDNPVLIQTMKSTFKKNDVPVVIEATGKGALKVLQQTLFACLIIDFNLPDYAGEDLFREIRALPDYSDTPLIVFTAEDFSVEEKHRINRYADHIIMKTPSAMKDVCLLAKTILDSQLHQAIAEDSLSDYHFDGKKMLLVDDDERNLYSLSLVLKDAGLTVISACGGQEALDLLSAHTDVDLILLDIMMPAMDGYEVMNIIKQNPSYTSIPIIALTAKAMEGDKEKCLAAGASQYLSKPVEIQDLLYAIAEELT